MRRKLSLNSFGFRRALPRKRQRPVAAKILFVFIIIILIIFYLFSLVERNLGPTILRISEVKAHIAATKAINTVLYEKVLLDANYEDLMFIHKDNEQRITMMQANSIKMSRISSQASLEIKEVLHNLKDEDFSIALGQVLGSQVLANYGPRIKIKIVPIGSVNIDFEHSFVEAGINQVRHIIYLNVETTVTIIVPLVTESVVVVSKVPIAETIIVGQVPETYLGLNLSGKKESINTSISH